MHKISYFLLSSIVIHNAMQHPNDLQSFNEFLHVVIQCHSNSLSEESLANNAEKATNQLSLLQNSDLASYFVHNTTEVGVKLISDAGDKMSEFSGVCV